MTRRVRFGIRFRLIGVLSVLIIVSLVMTSFYLAKINEDTLKLQVKEYAYALLRQLTDHLEGIATDTCRELGGLSQILNDRELNPDQTISMCRYWISAAPLLTTVTIYDAGGSLLDSFVGKESLTADSVPSHLETDLLQEKSVGSCSPNGVIAAGNRMFAAFVDPWNRDDSLEGFLWTAVDVTDLSKRLSEQLRERFDVNAMDVFIVDRNFEQIASSRWSGIPEQRNVRNDPLFAQLFPGETIPIAGFGGSVLDYVDPSGTDWLVSLSSVRRFEWVILVLYRRDVAYALLDEMQRRILLIGGLFLILAVAAGATMGQRMTGPILDVADGAKELATGNFAHRIDVSSMDEIGVMADTFNYLGQSLEDYDMHIKSEVAIRSDLSRYLSVELVNAIVDRKADLNLGGRRQQVTILYADVVSFTPLTETHPPEVIVGILNELFTILTQIIFRHGGMVDKFIGDCVMALFGAPDPDGHANEKAVAAAIDMIRWLKVGNRKWQREHGVDIKLAVAIHTGDVIIGNIGSKKRMEFTVIGDAVNTAARLEKIAQANQIVISDEVRLWLPEDTLIQSLGRFELKGKGQLVDVFEVISGVSGESRRQSVDSPAEVITTSEPLSDSHEKGLLTGDIPSPQETP